MPALSSDIAAAIRAAQVESWSNPAIKTRYPNARDGSLEPAEGFFDDAAHAIAAVTARGALIGTERRRFKVTVHAVIWPDPSKGTPTITLHDPEQKVSAVGMVSRIELQLQAELTIFEVMV